METTEPRSAWLHVRLTPSERAELQTTAQAQGQSVSELARKGIRKVASDPQPGARPAEKRP